MTRRSATFLGMLLLLLAGCGVPRDGSGLPPLPPLPPGAPFTFVVVGDNRGTSDGEQPPIFHRIVQAIDAAAPHLVFNTGDMIYGYTEDEAELRRQWDGYRAAVAPLRAPLFHAPGNHDLYDERSARVYRELWGEPYRAFDYGNARFVVLDTETEPFRVGAVQLEWLRRQLESAGERHVFLFLHKPLFPVDAHIGSSLDRHPAERDRLHRLLVTHRAAIRGAFLGHEHLYDFQERDGVPYHITGGGGANLYALPELGGFYHFLLVRVDGDRVDVEVRRTGAVVAPSDSTVVVAPGSVLEGWEEALFWNSWDETTDRTLTREHARRGARGMKLSFDLSHVETPLLYLPLHPARDLREANGFTVDVYVPPQWGGRLVLTPVAQAQEKHSAPSVTLDGGWNTVVTRLDPAWLPERARRGVRQLEWVLSSSGEPFAGWVVFDDFRVDGVCPDGCGGAEEQRSGADTSRGAEERRSGADTSRGAEERRSGGAEERRSSSFRIPQSAIRIREGGCEAGRPAPVLTEGWERALPWGVWGLFEPQTTAEFRTEGAHGLRARFDLAESRRPRLYTRLHPRRDLRTVDRLAVDVYQPPELQGTAAAYLALRADGRRYAAPPVALAPGWNTVVAELDGPWLPGGARAAAELLEIALLPGQDAPAGWVVFDNLRAQRR